MDVVAISRLLLVPFLIGAISMAGRRWGPVVAGWLSGFPVVAGPILLFIAIDHGPEFAATAALGTLIGMVAVLAFIVAYAWSATRHSWPVSLLAGLAVYALIAVPFGLVSLSFTATSALVLVALTGVRHAFPKPAPLVQDNTSRLQPLAPRMLAGALLVLLVTGLASRLGPRLSGVFAMFPVISSILAVFSHRSEGSAFVIRLLRGITFGLYAFAIFCNVLIIGLARLGTARGFGLALIIAALVQTMMLGRVFKDRSN